MPSSERSLQGVISRHVEAGELEILAVHLASVGIVVDEEDARTRFTALHRGPLIGRVNVKVDPTPTWLCTAMRPPIIWASRRQIDSPSPVPP